MKKYLFLFTVLSIVLFLTAAVHADEQKSDKTKKIPVTSWLKLGPVQTSLPVFNDVKSVKGKKFNLESLLKFEHADIKNLRPAEGDKFQWDNKTSLEWKALSGDTSRFILPVKSENPEINYLAVYIETKRWMKAALQIHSCYFLQAFVDGKLVSTKVSSEKAENDTIPAVPGTARHELKLETGKHILIVKLLKDPDNNADLDIRAELEVCGKLPESEITVDTSPKHSLTLKNILDGPAVSSVSISPDGQTAAVSMQLRNQSSSKLESWLELRRVKDGSLLQTFRGGMKISSLQWAPKGQVFTYKQTSKGKTTLWLYNMKTGSTKAVLKDVREMGSYRWAPDAASIVYSITDKAKEEKSGVQKLEGMPDRWPGWQDREFLYMVNVQQGTKRKLTHGKLSTDLNSFSPDSKKLIFSRSIVDFAERPFSKSEYYILNLETMALDSLFSSKWSGAAQFSPDGKRLLVTGGPSAFGRTGINLPDDILPNDYDTQAYIYNLADKKVTPITYNFDPSVDQAYWSKADNHIYIRASDKSYNRLYRYNVSKKSFKELNTGVEVISRAGVSFADNSPAAVYTGSSAAGPEKVCSIDLSKDRHEILIDPGRNTLKHLALGKVERWTFKNERGHEIEGRLHYPPDFDAEKKYPCIVYYYGGTSPVTRDFGGRYPKNFYAANGYIVYVLQPSGAFGFGQEFSALHVNDWGIIVADEIVDGVKKMLAAHPFIDEKRVGCIGASYGGFVTMLLQTRTDMFAAAISHAGISSLSSYWGEGFWGYSYGAVANANSFPWNRKDIFVNQSPLFSADKINTPLLLLHGMSDTNVPPGESIQLYAALKLLGKEVEFVQVADQNHWILDYKKRLIWKKTIIAWFDRYLKDQPQWWNELHTDK